jgi:hypothetical protein
LWLAGITLEVQNTNKGLFLKTLLIKAESSHATRRKQRKLFGKKQNTSIIKSKEEERKFSLWNI